MSKSAGGKPESTDSGTSALKRAGAALAVVVALTMLLIVADPSAFYLWVKAAHVIAVVAWMAGMLYLPRLFVYHAASAVGSPQAETFKLMERRLLRAIIDPAMVATWGFGLYLAWEGFRFAPAWLHLKIGLVVLLSALHGYLARHVRLFATDRNTKSVRHWRIVNEAPALLLIAIVILVVVKPF